MTYGVILIKLLPKKYEQDFLDGNLYLNSNRYFTAIDTSDVARFDAHEGIESSFHVAKLEIYDDNKGWLDLPIAGPISTRNSVSENSNVMCLFTLTDRVDDYFDDRNLMFGDRAVVIDNLLEFIARAKRAAAIVGRQLFHGPIEYVDRDSHNGQMGPFRKFNSHAHQNEFRFVLNDGTGEACRLQVGNIRDIAHSIPAERIHDFWRNLRQVQKPDA